jgi:hypothetical protein
MIATPNKIARFQYIDGDGVTRTVDAGGLKVLAKKGLLSMTTPVRREGREAWGSAGDIRGLEIAAAPQWNPLPADDPPVARRDRPARETGGWRAVSILCEIAIGFSAIAFAAGLVCFVLGGYNLLSLPGDKLAAALVKSVAYFRLAAGFAAMCNAAVFAAVTLAVRQHAVDKAAE